MKRPLYTYLIFTCAIVACGCRNETQPPEDFSLLGKLVPRSAQEITSSDLGIGGEVLDRDYANYDEYKEYLGPLGAKHIRLQSGWAKTERTKGQYDFEWLDEIVNDALGRSVRPWIQISYGNPIYTGGGGVGLGEGIPKSKEAIQAWSAYTEALILHFKNRVDTWEVWNEPDNINEGKDPDLYASFYYTTAKIIRENQPEAKIAGLSLAGLGRTAYVSGFLNYLKERKALDLLDIVTFHGYPRNPDWGMEKVDALKELVHSYRPATELRQGETGCPSRLDSVGAMKNYAWTELTQAKWNLRRALTFLGREYPFSLFTISEFIYNQKKIQGLNSKGILKINEDFSIAYAKPAYYAYQNLTSIFDHDWKLVSGHSQLEKSDESRSTYVWRKNIKGRSNYMLAVWLDGEIPSDSNDKVLSSLGLPNIMFKEPVYVDLRTGEVFTIPSGILRKMENGWGLIDVPIYDSPILIVEKQAISFK